MGRKPKLTAQLEAEGGIRAHRHANRVDNKPPEGGPVEPEGLSAEAALHWKRIVAEIPDAALGTVDSEALKELVQTYDLMLWARACLDENPIDKDARIAWCAYFDRWTRLGRDFGITPVARAGMKVPQADESGADPFDIINARYGMN